MLNFQNSTVLWWIKTSVKYDFSGKNTEFYLVLGLAFYAKRGIIKLSSSDVIGVIGRFALLKA